jgi:cytoskeletal protein RodZ
MRIILGIILGILIVFNWNSIKGYIDQKVTSPETAQEQSAATERKETSSKATEEKNSAKENKSRDRENSDSFSEFK